MVVLCLFLAAFCSLNIQFDKSDHSGGSSAVCWTCYTDVILLFTVFIFVFFVCVSKDVTAVAYSQMTNLMSVFVQVDTEGWWVVGFHTWLLRWLMFDAWLYTNVLPLVHILHAFDALVTQHLMKWLSDQSRKKLVNSFASFTRVWSAINAHMSFMHWNSWTVEANDSSQLLPVQCYIHLHMRVRLKCACISDYTIHWLFMECSLLVLITFVNHTSTRVSHSVYSV